MPKSLDLINKKFGMLTVLSKSEECSRRGRKWICICDCGKTKEKSVSTYHLTHARVISCGCIGTYNRVHFGDRRKTHGTPDKKLFWVWSTMKGRCINEKNKQFKDYGGRGITVCDEWMNFDVFYNWAIAEGYKQGLKIERINNDGGYNPLNCKWANDFEQSQNRRSVHKITHNNKTKTIAEWSRELNIPASTLYAKFRNGLDLF